MAAAATDSPSTEIVRTPMQEIVGQLRGPEFRDRIKDILPDNITPDRFVGVIMTALREDEAKQSKPQYMLVNADKATFFQAAIRCAMDGLLPDGREAALVVFNGKVQYMPMVGGIRKKAAEFGWTIRGQAVRENDHFEYTEEPPTLEFRQAPVGVDRGQLIYAYAVARHKDGRREQRVMRRDEVEKRHALAKTQNVWNAWDDEMWAKTAAKDICQEIPLDPNEREHFARMLAASELEPAAAADSLYGPGGGDALQAPPAALLAGDEGQQAPVTTEAAAVAPPVAGAPGGTTTTPAAPVATEAGYNPPDAVIQEAARKAGMLVPPMGQHAAADRTLLDILALGPDGIAWFRRFTGDPEMNADFAVELLAFTRAYLPDVYALATNADGIAF